MEFDPEIEAMNKIHAALKGLEDDAKQRVIDWAMGKFSLKGQKQGGGSKRDQLSGAGEIPIDIGSFESVAVIFAQAKPQTDADKVLVVASYLQNKGGEELTGHEINKELKHLGHGVSNITNAISSLKDKRPSLMIQTRKEGKSKQAQKKYKVTNEGFEAVKRLLSQAVDAQV